MFNNKYGNNLLIHKASVTNQRSNYLLLFLFSHMYTFVNCTCFTVFMYHRFWHRSSTDTFGQHSVTYSRLIILGVWWYPLLKHHEYYLHLQAHPGDAPQFVQTTLVKQCENKLQWEVHPGYAVLFVKPSWVFNCSWKLVLKMEPSCLNDMSINYDWKFILGIQRTFSNSMSSNCSCNLMNTKRCFHRCL